VVFGTPKVSPSRVRRSVPPEHAGRADEHGVIAEVGDDLVQVLGSQRLHGGRVWSTFGPHAIGAQRFTTVSYGTSFVQVAGAIQRKQAGWRP
jgi:hypothetical protein